MNQEQQLMKVKNILGCKQTQKTSKTKKKKFAVVLETTGTKQRCTITIVAGNKLSAEVKASIRYPGYDVVDCYEDNEGTNNE